MNLIGDLYTGKRQTERYDDHRRRNNRQNSGRATKFDTNRNYRNKNENLDEDSPTNNFKKRNNNNRYNKGSNNQLSEKTNGTNNGDDGAAGATAVSENGHTPNNNKYARNDSQNWNRRKERNDARDMYRQRYDDRPNRGNKPNSGNSNNSSGGGGGGGGNSSIKFDLANCSQREKLTREIDGGRLECLVCYDKIKPYSPIWSCANCFHIMHLNCIIKWADSSKSEEGWRCCACQNISKSLPHEYFCFCGKTKDPQYNRNDMAHSCGDVCGRIDRDNCPHPCTQLCHPGPCPQCQVSRKQNFRFFFLPSFDSVCIDVGIILFKFIHIKGDGITRVWLW